MANEAPKVGLGIDIGGSGIKGAPVDLSTGTFIVDRMKLATPQPSTPRAVAAAVAEIAAAFPEHVDPGCPLGATFPAVIQHGVARSAANVDKSWIGVNVEELLAEATGRAVHVLNDADAAAVAEHRYGAAAGVRGVVLLTTLGTGIGTALLVDGRLVPNTEFGHLEIDGHDAESRAASSAKEREDLSYERWARERLQRYYSVVEDLLWPDLIVVGGGVSRKADKFLPHLRLRTPIVPAQLRNTAGIVGAAALAADLFDGA
ncbi:polyphosphate--glucose phosphotransferase [Marinactinospora thermotolerans]|uniref:Polyphosphate glucokinase n=1 Tax=Marinactinospora thermotolerans DSM 45154 TaxID=1122192 RepID=A0A1T4T612_9ACTN|nr:ROK family protein [Marinactinospora thermotolerans]SKA35882.1 Polyphosphate glucokinase [Marinactinospora thermotolerans DSM 45154]